MLEAEFDFRIKQIQKDLDELFNSPLIQLHTINKTTGNLDQVENQYRRLLLRVASNVTQIEQGIKNYARPACWSLIEEGTQR